MQVGKCRYLTRVPGMTSAGRQILCELRDAGMHCPAWDPFAAGETLLDAWTGFTRFIFWNERPPDGYTWWRVRLTRTQTTSRPDNIWPDMWKHVSDAANRKEKRNWIIEKPTLDDARQLHGIFFIEPDDEELRHAIRNALRKLEIPMPAAMPSETPENCRDETCRSIGKHKTKYACVVDADESMRIRLECVPQRYHEDHIAAKGINSLSHYNLVHKFLPMPQENTGCKGSS